MEKQENLSLPHGSNPKGKPCGMECSQKQIQELLGLGTGTNELKKLVDKGVVVLVRNSPVADRRTYDAIKSVRNFYSTQSEPTGNLDDLLKTAKIKKDSLEIKIKQFKLDKLEADIVLIKDAEEVYLEQINIAKQALRGMGARLCSQLTDESNTNRIRLLIDEVINNVLVNMAEGKARAIRRPDIQKIIRDLDKAEG